MRGGPGRAPQPTEPSAAATRRWLPFWILQASEVAVAVVFAEISVHVVKGRLLIIAAFVLAGLAITARGPLGIFRICGRRLHLLVMTAVAIAVALAPIVPALRPDIQGIIVVEFGAVGLIRLATLTRSDPSGPRVAGGMPGAGTVIDATATVDRPHAQGTHVAADRSAEEPGAPAADPDPDPTRGPTSSGAAARWIGRTTGAAAAAGKRTAARHRPEVEVKVRRTIRGAGRVAGRIASSPEPEDPIH